MIDVNKLLYEICDDEKVFNDDCELIESGILDSYAFILLFAKLADMGLELQPTRIDRSLLKTPRGIKKLVEENIVHL